MNEKQTIHHREHKEDEGNEIYSMNNKQIFVGREEDDFLITDYADFSDFLFTSKE